MSAKNKLLRTMKKALAGKNEKTMPASLGDYSGNVGTGVAFQVYARLVSGQVIKVINQIAPNTWDLKVTLGKRDGQRFWQVIGVRDAYNGLAAPNVAAHNSEHRYLPIYRDQIIPLLIFPINDTLTVQVYGSIVVIDNEFVNVENQIIDLAASLPVEGARYVLFQYDAAGVVTTKDGSVVESKEVLTLADIPAPDSGCVPFGAVRIAEGYTEFTYLVDFVYPFGVGGVGGDGTYLRLDTSNNPLTGQLEIVNSLAGSGGLYVQNFGNGYNTDLEQYTVDDNVDAPTLFLYRETSGIGNITGALIEGYQDALDYGVISGPFIHILDEATNQFFDVDKDGNVNIPTGSTYNINGSPHTHAGGGDIKSDGSVPFTGDIRGKDFIGLRSSVITRTGDYISSIAKTGGRTITITRDGNNYITSIADGTNTWAFTRNGDNQITAVTVT